MKVNEHLSKDPVLRTKSPGEWSANKTLREAARCKEHRDYRKVV